MNHDCENFDRFIQSIRVSDIDETKSKFEEAKTNFVFKYFSKEDKYGLKPIHWACLTSNIEILEWMLIKKCDIEALSRNGWRPIHFASFIGNEDITEFLIKNSCELNCKTSNGETVLDVANGDCNHEFIDEILNENINLKIGLLMGLKCGVVCDHEFCLKSLLQPEHYIIEKNQSKNLMCVRDSFSNRNFAMKIVDENEYDKYEIGKCVGPKLNEIRAYLNHSNIIKHYGLIKIQTKMILFKEYMNNRTLRDKIKQIGPLNNFTVYRYCKDILQAVAFLHDNKILHRFINPAKSIFIDNNGGCKLALSDYSYSLADGDVLLNDEWLNKYRKFSFGAPELVVNGILSYPYDIWLMGCTMIEMSTRDPLNYHTIKFDDIDKIIPQIPDEMLQSFIRSMIIKNPNERSTANGLLNHKYMKNTNYQSIFDNSLIDRKKSLDKIQNAINKTPEKNK